MDIFTTHLLLVNFLKTKLPKHFPGVDSLKLDKAADTLGDVFLFGNFGMGVLKGIILVVTIVKAVASLKGVI